MQAEQFTAGLYRYQAVVRSVHDGDTISADVDLGFGTWRHNEPLRLRRINAPEVRGKERQAGLAARDRLRHRIDGRAVVLETTRDKKGSFHRYLVEVWLLVGDEYINMNDWLVDEGLAEYRKY